MLTKKNITILIIFFIISVIAVIFFTYNKPKENKQKEAIALAETFIKDYTTYGQTTPIKKNRLKKYFDDNYYKEFDEKYANGEILIKNKKGERDSSKYISSSTKILKENAATNSITLESTYKFEKTEYKGSKIVFVEEKTANIVVKKNGPSYKIIGFIFAIKE